MKVEVATGFLFGGFAAGFLFARGALFLGASPLVLTFIGTGLALVFCLLDFKK